MAEIALDVVLVFAVLALAIAAIGFFLPEAHVAKTRCVINRAPDVLFALLLDYPAWPKWNKEIGAVERLPDQNGHAVWKLGRLPVEHVEAVPPGAAPGRIVTRIADPSLPFAGTWTWTFEPEGGASRVTIVEEGRVKNPIFRFLARFVFGHHATAKSYFHALGQHFEHTAKPEELE